VIYQYKPATTEVTPLSILDIDMKVRSSQTYLSWWKWRTYSIEVIPYGKV